MEDQKELPFPYEFEELKPEEEELITTNLNCMPASYIRLGPKGYVVFKPYKKDAANIYNMPLRPSDVFVASYQRSGTTWTQELVWLILNDLNYEKAAEIPLTHRYPFLELRSGHYPSAKFAFLMKKVESPNCITCNKIEDVQHLLMDCVKNKAEIEKLERENCLNSGFMYFDEDTLEDYVDKIAKTEENIDREKFGELMNFLAKPVSPMLAAAPLTATRFIKTHLPMSLLPPKLLGTAKMVYVARDPRDVAVSCYYHIKFFKMNNFEGDFKDFWNLFRRDLFTLTPYFEHVKEAWEKRNDLNMLFLFYEDLSKDLPASIRRVADFFGKQLNEDKMNRLCDHLNIENFKNNKSVNYEDLRELGVLAKDETFIRKGKTGGWRAYFDEEMTQQADRWIEDNLLDTDLRFPHMKH